MLKNFLVQKLAISPFPGRRPPGAGHARLQGRFHAAQHVHREAQGGRTLGAPQQPFGYLCMLDRFHC